MTTAQKGLGKALARAGASGSVLALAEMSTEDLIAGLSDEQRAGLSAALTPPAPSAGATDDNDSDDGEPGDMCSECKAPMKDGKCEKCGPKSGEANGDEAGAGAAAAAGAALKADARVKAVAAAVAADGPCKGKADVALSILADDEFADLSAAAVIKMVGMSGGAADASGDEEAAARAAMQSALGNNRNSSIEAGGNKPSQDANHGWEKIHAEVRARHGR